MYPNVHDFGALGDGSPVDHIAIQACLNAHGVAFLPFWRPNSTTPAVYELGDRLTLQHGQHLIGDPRKPIIRQAPNTNAILMRGHNNAVSNVRFDQSQVVAAHASTSTILLDTIYSPMQHNSIEGVIAGIDLDYASLQNGFGFICDLPHAENKIVDFKFTNSQVFGAKSTPFWFTQLFASVYFDRVVSDWTRQDFAPDYSAFVTHGGEGIFFDECAAQGMGRGDTGSELSNAFDINGGRAIRLTNCYGDTVGGSGLKASNVDGLTVHGHRSSLCGSHQIDLDSISNLSMHDVYAGGRKGREGPWVPSDKNGLRLKNVNRATISGINFRHNTGSGACLIDSSANVIVGGQLLGNGPYGIEEADSSNFNAYVGLTYGFHEAGGGAENAKLTGAYSYASSQMLHSGASIAYVLGAGTW